LFEQSALTKLNVHLCFCKNWFSRHQRAEGEAILTHSPTDYFGLLSQTS